MIELVYSHTEKQQQSSEDLPYIPKNIRQVGNIMDSQKIYVEDYVVTHIKQSIKSEIGSSQMFILLGKRNSSNGVNYYFVSGAIRVSNIEFSKQIPILTTEHWAEIYEIIKKNFDTLDILGWVLSQGESARTRAEEFLTFHNLHFSFPFSLFSLIDSQEEEEKLYIFQNNSFQKQPGYYIYYEKNESMQEYMIAQKGADKKVVKEPGEKAVQEFRTRVRKVQRSARQSRMKKMTYGFCSLALVVACGSGITMMNNAEKMKKMETTIEALSSKLYNGVMKEEGAPALTKPLVENVAGEVHPIDSTLEPIHTDPSSESDPIGTDNSADIANVAEEQGNSDGENNGSDTQESQSQLTGGAILERGYYIVQKGDTLLKISRAIYGSDGYVQKLSKENNLTNQDQIFEGQKLKLPD